MSSYGIIGYTFGDAGNVHGCEEGPTILRKRHLINRIERLGNQVVDLGDVSENLTPELKAKIIEKASPDELKTNHFLDVAACCTSLRDKVSLALNNSLIPILLGGDHSLSIGSIAGLSNFYAEKNEKIGVIWIDTHPDINTPATSPSNNIFGMALAFLLGLIPGYLSSLHKLQPAFDLKNLVYIGLRDVDPGEKEIIKRLGIQAYTMKEVDMYGISKVIEETIKIASKNTAGYVVSFDLDVCDPEIVPGIGTPIRGGLNYREAHLLFELLYEAKNTLAIEIVELNPKLDINYETADLALTLLESAIGKTIL